VSHGWHVGLVVRGADFPADLWPERAAGRAFVEVGWGDADFYPASRPGVVLALRAALCSRGSVLHVAAFDVPSWVFFPGAEVLELTLPAGGERHLARFLREAYARDEAGQPEFVAPPLYGAGGFYRARDRYHLLANSNQWTARALRAAGLPVSVPRALTAGALLAQVRPWARVLRPASDAGARSVGVREGVSSGPAGAGIRRWTGLDPRPQGPPWSGVRA
jgi:uncharacterized protein (TIGR02117 family)